MKAVKLKRRISSSSGEDSKAYLRNNGHSCSYSGFFHLEMSGSGCSNQSRSYTITEDIFSISGKFI